MLKSNLRRPALVTVLSAAVLVSSTGPGAPAVISGAVSPSANGLWLAPEPGMVSARARLARAVESLAGGRAAEALPAFLAAGSDPDLGPYARLFAARAYLSLFRPVDTGRTVQQIMAASPSEALAEAALNLAVEAASAAKDSRSAFAALRDLASRPNSAPVNTEFRLLQAAIEVGDRAAANASFQKLFFDYAGTLESADAIEEMQRIGVARPVPTQSDAARHVARAEKLFAAAKYTDARIAFEALEPLVSGDDRTLVELRLAQCDLLLKKLAVAAPALRALAAKPGPRGAEAEFHHLAAVKALGKIPEYVSLARSFVERHSQTSPALGERALNDLATFHILEDDDESAAKVAAEHYSLYPQGALSDRAAWRSGWWAYKKGEYAETIRVFESAAVGMRRADYRPAWLDWAARAHLRLGHRDAALDGFRRVIADYRNSYYGRAATYQAERILSALRPKGAGPVSPARRTWPSTLVPSPRPPNASVIEHLLAAEMYDEAVAELQRLRATGSGSPLVDATLAYALNRQGKLRFGITAMRRAYPQFMAEGGEALPREILTVIFPIDHWNLLQFHASAQALDQYLVAALVAQESTFQADVRSSANAWGLMQIIPATGRRYATTLGIKPFSTSRLVEPEVNVRIGTRYFADLLKRFGAVAPALAGYNAGPDRAARWLAERKGFDRDEWIDDIPFPETQNYVKRIIGTAEDYRILYGGRR